MLPIDFEGTNKTFTKPGDMTDEQCGALKAFVGTDGEGFPFILSAWQPTEKDIANVNAGRPIMLKIVSYGMPPVSVYTYDENYQAC